MADLHTVELKNTGRDVEVMSGKVIESTAQALLGLLAALASLYSAATLQSCTIGETSKNVFRFEITAKDGRRWTQQFDCRAKQPLVSFEVKDGWRASEIELFRTCWSSALALIQECDLRSAKCVWK